MKVDSGGWQLTDVKVLFQVDGVIVKLVIEVVNGVISHEIKSPRLTPIIAATVEVDQVLFTSPLDG